MRTTVRMMSDMEANNTNNAAPVQSPHGAKLRGLGRAAYRAGKNASQAVTFAREQMGHDLDDCERLLVMYGWRDERTDSNPYA